VFYLFMQVVGVDRHACDPCLCQLRQVAVQERFAANGEKRLGQLMGMGPQARTQTSRKDHGFHASSSGFHASSPGCHTSSSGCHTSSSGFHF
jgi:hypothetical protein